MQSHQDQNLWQADEKGDTDCTRHRICPKDLDSNNLQLGVNLQGNNKAISMNTDSSSTMRTWHTQVSAGPEHHLNTNTRWRKSGDQYSKFLTRGLETFTVTLEKLEDNIKVLEWGVPVRDPSLPLLTCLGRVIL